MLQKTIPYPNVAHRQFKVPSAPVIRAQAKFKSPSKLSLDTTHFAEVAALGDSTISQRALLDKFIDLAPSRMKDDAHPATVAAVKSLDWHAKELHSQLEKAKGTPMESALEVALDTLEAAAAILKCLEVK